MSVGKGEGKVDFDLADLVFTEPELFQSSQRFEVLYLLIFGQQESGR